VLIFEAAGVEPPRFAHLPLLVAPDGAKLSKRKHGLVVSVTTYRDAGFLSHAFLNFLCLLGWSPKDDRERMTLDELTEAFTLEGINRSNAVVNFSEADPFDPKAVWLNAETIRTLTPFVTAAGFDVSPEKMALVTPLIQERIRLLSEVTTVGDFFFVKQLAPYDAAELIPQKGDRAMAVRALEKGAAVLAAVEFRHDPLEQALRAASAELGIKAGQMFQPVRVAVCGRKNAPPLFGTLEALGRETCLERIGQALEKLKTI
jgi:glutamyl-tRNA synthetase